MTNERSVDAMDASLVIVAVTFVDPSGGALERGLTYAPATD
jgi:hypothetical protein